jgi:hypothetical protein
LLKSISVLNNSIIFVETFKSKNMETEEIIGLIKQREKEYYATLMEMTRAFGSDDPATNRMRAKWGAITELIDTLKLNEDE